MSANHQFLGERRRNKQRREDFERHIEIGTLYDSARLRRKARRVTRPMTTGENPVHFPAVSAEFCRG